MEKDITTTLRMTKKLHSKLREYAKEKGYSLNTIMVQAFWNFIEKEESR